MHRTEPRTASHTPTPWQDTVARALPAVLVIQGATFLLGALLHLGVALPLGFATLDEPRILPATVVEGLCGLTLLAAAYGARAGRSWGWEAAVAATVFSVGGVLLGIAALAFGGGPRTELNDIYHRVVLVTLFVTLAALLLPGVRAAVERATAEQS